MAIRTAESIDISNHSIFAIIPAAGRGTRVGSATPKQYIEVFGVPLVAHCLRTLISISWIKKVVLVVDEVETAKPVLKLEDQSKILYIQGKESRHRSIFEGLRAIESDSPEFVIIHDGARPILTEEILKQVTLKAIENGAAGYVRPLTSTVVCPSPSGFLTSCLERSKYRNSETPQTFSYRMIYDAYTKATKKELDHGTECLDIALTHGKTKAFLLPGPSCLWKVTNIADFELAQVLLSKEMLRISVVYDQNCSCNEYNSGYVENTLNTPEELRCSTISHELNFNEKFSFDEGEPEIIVHACEGYVYTLKIINREILKKCLKCNLISRENISLNTYNCLIYVKCVNTISEAEMYMKEICSLIMRNVLIIIFIFNINKFSHEKLCFSELRDFISKNFSSCSRTVLTVFQKDFPKNDSGNSEYGCENSSSFTSFIRDILNNPFSRTWHRQIFLF